MTMKSMIRSDNDGDGHALDLHRPCDVIRHARQADQVRVPGLALLLALGHKLQEHRHRVPLAAVLVGRNPRHHPIRLCKLLQHVLPSTTPLLSSPWPSMTSVTAIDMVITIAASPLLSSSLRDRSCHCHPDCKPCNHGRHERHEIIIITHHQHHPQQQQQYWHNKSYRLHEAHRPDLPRDRAPLLQGNVVLLATCCYPTLLLVAACHCCLSLLLTTATCCYLPWLVTTACNRLPLPAAAACCRLSPLLAAACHPSSVLLVAIAAAACCHLPLLPAAACHRSSVLLVAIHHCLRLLLLLLPLPILDRRRGHEVLAPIDGDFPEANGVRLRILAYTDGETRRISQTT